MYHEEEERTGTKIIIDYSVYLYTCYMKHFAEMFQLLTNWKSNKGYNVIDFKTFYGTDKMEITFDCNEKTALEMIGAFNYYDYENKVSNKEEKERVCIKVLSVESIPVFELVADDDNFNEFAVLIINDL